MNGTIYLLKLLAAV